MTFDLPRRQPPETRGNYAVSALRRALSEGVLPPGQYLAADDLAQRLGISQIPVREALRFLEAQGLLRRDSRGRVFVRSLSLEEVEEVYALREVLEVTANRIAVPDLPRSDLAAMERALETMTAALAEGDYPAYARANREFHFVPLRRAGGVWRLNFLELLWDAAARYQSALMRSGGGQETIQAQHGALLIAYRNRSVVDVEQLMAQHRSVTILATRKWIGSASG